MIPSISWSDEHSFDWCFDGDPVRGTVAVSSVGTQMNVSHVSATPAGMKVRFETELTGIAPNGKILTFKVAAYDEAGLIGEGTHERAIVAKERFEAKAQAKRG